MADIFCLATLDHPRRRYSINHCQIIFDALIPCDDDVGISTLICSMSYRSRENVAIQPGTYHLLAKATRSLEFTHFLCSNLEPFRSFLFALVFMFQVLLDRNTHLYLWVI